MKAMVLSAAAPVEQRPLQWREVPDPTPEPGEILLQVTACGVCRSNLHMVEGDWLPATPASFPIVPGHEVVGRVAALGDAVTDISVGDRVGVQPIWSTCGNCRYCLTGREQLCGQRQITGETRDGGYAETMLADATHVHRLPDGLTDSAAAPLFCPGITAYGAVKKAALAPGQTVAVLGVGGVGHLVLQMAGLTGAEVHAITRSAIHREVAEELGAVRSYLPSASGGGGDALADAAVDAAIVFAPSPSAVAEAMRVVRPGGRVVLGVAETVGMMDIGDEKTIVASVLGSRWEMREVLGLAAAGRLRTITDGYHLADGNAALADLKAGRIRGRAVLVP